MRFASSIVLCFMLTFGAQSIQASEPEIVFNSFGGSLNEVDSSLHARFLGQTLYKTCVSSSCSSYEGSLTNDDMITYYIDLDPGSEMVLDIKVGKPRMSFLLELATMLPVQTRTNIKINPSDKWPNNALPAASGSSWEGTLSIPSSSSATRFLRFEIKNNANFLQTTAGFRVTVLTSVDEEADEDNSSKPAMGLIIAVAIAGMLLIIGCYICFRIKRNRRLQRERLAQADAANLSHIDLNTSSFAQLNHVSSGVPIYLQQPHQNYQMYPQQFQYPMQPMQPMQFGHPIPQYYPGFSTPSGSQLQPLEGQLPQIQPPQMQPPQIHLQTQPPQPQPTQVQPMQIVIQAPAKE